MTGAAITVGALAVFWLLVRRRLFELWREVQAARRQIDIQRVRLAELAPALADALGDRLEPALAAALRGDDVDARSAALAALPPATDDEPARTTSMRRDLTDIQQRLVARQRVLAVENARYRWLAPAWIGRLVGAPLPAALPPVPVEAQDIAFATIGRR